MIVLLCIAFAIFFVVLTTSLSLKRLRNIRKQLNWLPSVPGWPIVGNALEFGDTTDTINDVSRLISKHGKTIFLDFVTQPNIFTADYDFVEFILSSHNVLNKSEDYRFLHNWLGTGLLTSDGPKWKKRRRMTTPAFHFSILEQFVESFDSNGKILIEKLKQKVGENSVDIYPFINLYALDVICESAMGVSLDVQRNQNCDYVKNVKLMCRIGVVRAISVFKSNNFLYLFTPEYYKEKNAIKALHKVTYSVIDSRMQKLGNEMNVIRDIEDEIGRKRKLAFLDILLKSTVGEDPLTRKDIREEVDTFMFEGHDTTSSAMSFALYLLAGHPEVQERAVAEQKLIFGSDIFRRSNYDDLQRMKYLECVIKESLRIYPSVPMFGRHTNRELIYKGNIIPKGVDIVIFSYGVLNDPVNYPDPGKFNPSRFELLDGTKPFAFIPFSAGPRNCIGQKFALLEMKSTLSKILRNFELLPAVPEHIPILASEAVLKSQNGFNIKFEERKW